MSRPDRMITAGEVEEALATCELVEDYPNDIRGHSCLILGYGDEMRPIHLVCTPTPDYLAIVTAYIPDQSRWSSDFKERQ